jgi:hypothetical protein
VYVTYLPIANDFVNLAKAAAADPLDDLVGWLVGFNEPWTTLGHDWFAGNGGEKRGNRASTRSGEDKMGRRGSAAAARPYFGALEF